MMETSGNRGTGGPKQQEIFVKEELKIAVKFTLDKFRYDEEQKGKVFSDFGMILHEGLYFYLVEFKLVSRAGNLRQVSNYVTGGKWGGQTVYKIQK